MVVSLLLNAPVPRDTASGVRFLRLTNFPEGGHGADNEPLSEIFGINCHLAMR